MGQAQNEIRGNGALTNGAADTIGAKILTTHAAFLLLLLEMYFKRCQTFKPIPP
jgi:hypothetical protein